MSVGHIVRQCEDRRVAVSAVPDILAPGPAGRLLRDQPGPRLRRGRAHFANPRNDFWRLLHAAGFTPRALEPDGADELLD